MTLQQPVWPGTAGVRYALGFALLWVTLTTALAGQAPAEPPIEAAFRALEDAELVGTEADYQAAFAALGKRLDPKDSVLQERYQRLGCWMQPDANQAQISQAIDNASRWLNRAMARGDSEARVDYQLCRGWFREQNNQNKLALADYEAALTQAELSENRRLIADALSSRGELLALQGDLAQALSDLQVAHQLYHLIGNRYWTAYTLSMVANTYRRMGDFVRAKELLHEVIDIYDQRKDVESAENTRFILALTYDDLGDYEEAYAIYKASLRRDEASGDNRALLGTLIAIADNRLRAGDLNAATQALNRAEPLLDGELDPVNSAMWNLFKASQLVAVEQYPPALALLNAAEPVVEAQDQQRYLAWIQKLKAEALGAMGDWQAAYVALKTYQRTQEQLAAKLRDQTSTRMRIEFDAARKDAENRALKSEREIRQARLKFLEERKRWQGLLLTLAAIGLVGLIVLAVRQWRRSHSLSHLAMTDELTGLPNRRSIYQSGKLLLDTYRQAGANFSLLVFDVDYFKRINDTWGHDVGDRVLQKIAAAAAQCLRSDDRLGRTGGEEFLVTLPGADLTQAMEVAQRLCAQVADVDMRDVADDLVVTVSVGVAQCRADDREFSELVNRADNALYRAKDEGRNRVALDGLTY
jgi:diguanylate cyclase (GGDEF)-like protein